MPEKDYSAIEYGEKTVPSSPGEMVWRGINGRKKGGTAVYKTKGNGTKEFSLSVRPKSNSYPSPGVLYRFRSGASLKGDGLPGESFLRVRLTFIKR